MIIVFAVRTYPGLADRRRASDVSTVLTGATVGIFQLSFYCVMRRGFKIAETKCKMWRLALGGIYRAGV